ncbi:hypothetical protein GGX14DRAFT_658360 [Mycena pura]|uniref:F-box domain-containing protein n=1 Tax=Mycena pura TaxID=153505 RepID=A0AAD7E269_9AGAR|nr:hypothetical protein GGX14DRAFT_658360 [Mycena pura]
MSIQNGGHPSDRPGVSISFSLKLPDSQLSAQERRTALAKVKSQIALHKKSIEVLEKEREELEKDLSLVVYPVLTLPVEIISRIFLRCLPSHGRIAPSPTTAPLLLAQICRHWREVALSTSRLWSSLYLYGGWDSDTIYGRRTVPVDLQEQNLLRTWFARAKGSPLSLGLNFQFRMASTALLDLVSSYASQIQHLDLHMWPEQFQEFRPFLTPFPLLQHLATVHSDDVRNLLIASPLIRELRLLRGSKLDSLVDQSLPFLTHLEVTTITAEKFLAVLRNFPALSHFTCFSNVSNSFSIPDASPPITFPHLSSFHTTGSSLLRLVAFPSLNFLEIDSYADPDVVQEFISRSSCTIRHLVISFEDQAPDEIADWLSIFPSISVLEVKECLEIALPKLVDYLSSPTLMPWLTDISICSHIDSSNIQSDCYDALLKMLLHRRRHPLRAAILRRFHIKFTSPIDDCIQMWQPGHLATLTLEQLLEDGLDFGVCVEFGQVGIQVWPATYGPEHESHFP